MKWFPYLSIWIYGLSITFLGWASIYNPANLAAVAKGMIPTDVFTVIGILVIYFAYASTKQYFNQEAREKKRFDLQILSVIILLFTLVPLAFLVLYGRSALADFSASSGEQSYIAFVVGLGIALIVILNIFYYSFRIFQFNK